MEDDQLRLRVDASGGLAHGVLRPPAGSGAFTDLDPVRMLELTQSQAHRPLFNKHMIQPGPGIGGSRMLDATWRGANGLQGIAYEALRREERSVGKECAWLQVHCHLGAMGEAPKRKPKPASTHAAA